MVKNPSKDLSRLLEGEDYVALRRMCLETSKPSKKVVGENTGAMEKVIFQLFGSPSEEKISIVLKQMGNPSIQELKANGKLMADFFTNLANTPKEYINAKSKIVR